MRVNVRRRRSRVSLLRDILSFTPHLSLHGRPGAKMYSRLRAFLPDLTPKIWNLWSLLRESYCANEINMAVARAGRTLYNWERF